MEFKIGDKVRLRWTTEQREQENFHGLTFNTASRLDGREGTVAGATCDVLLVDFGGTEVWFIPKRSLESVSVPPTSDLKTMNTQPDRTVCASCGGPLVNPVPWLASMRHCPKCEP